MLTKMNEGPIGGHYGFHLIMNKLLIIGYWWLNMQEKIVKLCQNCEIYVPRIWAFELRYNGQTIMAGDIF
jgi:hypothetical protein